MATPTIPNGEEHFFVIPYEGNGTAQKVGKFVPFTDQATIANSVIFNSPDDPKLGKTFSGAGTEETWTFSCWIKLGIKTSNGRRMIFSAGSAGSNYGGAEIGSAGDNSIEFYNYVGGSYDWRLVTRRQLTDTSKWYHLLFVSDTTNSTEADRARIYIDGDRITSFSTASYPSLNYANNFWMGTTEHEIGTSIFTTQNFDGYMAEVNNIDNQALLPASFGITDTSTGRWIPKTVEPFPTTTTDIAVTVVSSGGNKFAVDGVTQGTVTLIEGATYKFDQSDSSNATHPLRFSTTSDGTHNSGTEYTTGVTTVGTPGSSGAYTQITVATGAPTLYYYCSSHSGMGGQANTQDQYGTNGFRLTFADSSAFGDDTSGNTNDFTATNLATTDQTTDSPSSNHATLNAAPDTGGTLSEGNLKLVSDSSGYSVKLTTLRPRSGKYYAEFTIGSGGTALIGVQELTTAPSSSSTSFPVGSGSFGWYEANGNIYTNGTTVAKSGTTYTSGDVLAIALDLDNQEVKFYKNNSLDNTIGLTGKDIAMAVADFSNANPATITANFGQKSFTYTPPTGFVALQQDNLPETDRGISGLTWTKDRHVANSWMCIDSSRIYTAEGVPAALNTNNTNKEYGQVDFVDGINKFLKGGFAVATRDNSNSYMNKSGNSYINFSWVANSGTKVTNTTGSITSTVQANTTAGFSIVQYVGTGSSGSVGHGLSAAPSWMIIKDRDNDSTNWRVYHKSLGGITKYQILNTNGATQTASMWGAPTASAFIIGGTGYEVNESGRNYVAYCWHEVEGYSKFGKYVGTGVADGPFIYTGFKPRFFLHKANNGATWYAYDTFRSPINPVLLPVYPDGTYVEYPNVYGFDLNSNGIKVRQPTGYGANYSGVETYYVAFAEHPFVGDGTNPTTAK